MALDLVQIGFEVQAKGLDEANQKTDKLIDKFGGVGEAGEKAAARFEKAQERLRSSIQKTEKTVEYMNKGFSSSIASKSAAFKVAGISDSEIQAFQHSMKALENAKQQASSASGGFSSLNSSLSSLNATAKNTQSSFDSLMATAGNIAKFSIISTAVYALINSFTSLTAAMVSMADEYTSIQNRLKLYIKDTKELAEVNAFAAQASIENNVGLKETATLFTRLVPAMKNIGANTAATKTVVDAFGKSMRIGGATLREAEAATIQFSQAMASGKLAGDEFRSISEASPRFLKAIADGSGIAASKLKEMSAAGKLTTEVIARALVKEYSNLKKESESLGYTLEQGTNALKVGFMSLIGEFNEGAGITQFLGSKLAELGLSMIDGVKGAKQAGADFKALIISLKDEFEAAFAAMKFAAIALSSFMLGRFVASIAAAVASTVSGLAAMAVAAKAYFTAVSMEAGKAAAAITVVGSVAKGAGAGLLGLFGGGIVGAVGLVATIAGVAGSYLLMKKNSEDATKELALQGAAASKTKEELLALQGAQKATEKQKLAEEFAIQNAELERYNTLIGNTVAKIYSQNTANKQAADVLEGVRTGTMSYNEALEKLNTMKGVNPKFIEELQEQIKKYEEIRVAATKNADAQGVLGTSVTLMGNKLQNTLPFLQDFKNGVKGIGDEALITGDKVNKFIEDLNKDTTLKQTALILRKRYGERLSQSSADKLAKVGYDRVAGGAKAGLLKEEVEAALRNDAAAKANSDYDRALSAANKASKKQESDQEKAKKNYQEQIDYVYRLQNLLESGLTTDQARVAAEKEYAKNIKGTSLALEVAEAKRALARTEFSMNLSDEIEMLKVIDGLQRKGATAEQAKALARAKFNDDEQAMVALSHQAFMELEAKKLNLEDQVRTQAAINKFLREGKSLEEATTEATFARVAFMNNGLTSAQLKFKAEIKEQEELNKARKVEATTLLRINELERSRQIIDAAKTVAGDRAAVAVQKLLAGTDGLKKKDAESLQVKIDLAALSQEELTNKSQLIEYLSDEADAIKEIRNLYPTIDDHAVYRLDAERKILAIAKEQAEQRKRDRENPIGDFSKVDFSVFGDFGNPFESALAGLNEMLYKSSEIEDRYNLIFDNVRQRLSAVKKGSKEAEEIESERSRLVAQYEKEHRESRESSYAKGLKFAKSFFKEESKGYKIISALEMALQAKKIAFAVWEKRDFIKTLALKAVGYATDLGKFLAVIAAKTAAQMGLNMTAGIGAILSAAQQPGPAAFVGFAAMAALVAGLGVMVKGGGSSGNNLPKANDGTGTVFGDKEAKSESIKKAIELLADNSKVELPITSAMLKSLRNIENSFGGLTNLLIRENPASGLADSVAQGSYKTKLGESMGAGISMGVSYLTKVALAKGTAALIASGGAIGGAILSAGSAVISTVSSAVGASISAVAGAFSLGIGLLVGQVIGKPIAKLVGKLFGKKQTVIGQGLYGGDQSLGNIVDKGFNLQEYVDIETKKKRWGRTKTSYSTRYGAASGELTNQFSLIFRGFYDAMLQAAPLLTDNVDGVVERLRSHIVKLGKIDLKGLKGDEIQEKIEAVFGKAADEIARAALPFVEDFQKVGEGYFETVVRVASGIESAIAYTSRLNVVSAKYTDILNRQGDVATEIVRESVLLAEGYKGIVGGFYDLVAVFDGSAEELTNFVIQLRDLQDAIVATGKNGDYLTSTMFLGAGGLDRLSNGLDAYFEMLSPAEQAAELTRRLANEFEIFGLQLPTDIKAFRNLVNGIDISTESGQKLYGQVIALAPEFNDLQDSLENANSAVNDLVKSLRDLAEEARKARGETQQPRNLAYLRNEFNNAAVLAAQGDTAAAEKLLTVGKDLMQVSKQYSTSSSEYSNDLAVIQRASTIAANAQEMGLGYTTSPLTPTSGSTVSSTVSTTNSETDAKIEQLRADLITAITAVARYTQDSATRLQRWDDGDGMLVKVNQEPTDAPIRVSTV